MKRLIQLIPESLQDRLEDIFLLLLRVGAGFFMAYKHGWGKFSRLFAEGPLKFGDPIGLGPGLSLGLAGFAEFICAVLIMIGLFTRLSSIPLIITMFVASVIVNIPRVMSADADTLGQMMGKLELSSLYLLVFLFLLAKGAGKYSVDHWLGNKNHLSE